MGVPNEPAAPAVGSLRRARRTRPGSGIFGGVWHQRVLTTGGGELPPNFGVQFPAESLTKAKHRANILIFIQWPSSPWFLNVFG